MIRAWLGVALLAGSWLLGLGYFEPAHGCGWVVAVALGTILLAGHGPRMPSGRPLVVCVAMLAAAAWFMPWPYRAAGLLMAAGLALQAAPPGRRWTSSLGSGALKAGIVLLAQSAALWAYAAQTARCHDLPWPLRSIAGGVIRSLGVDAAVDARSVAMHSIREVHRLAATWELLLGPATFCFLAGGLVMLGLEAANSPPDGRRFRRWIGSVRVFTLVVVAWLPVRMGLLVGLYLHRAISADAFSPPTVMNQFLSPWVHLALLCGPALLAWRCVRMPAGKPTDPNEQVTAALGNSPGGRHFAAAVALAVAGAAVLSFIFQWDPVGTRKSGRVMVVERHSTWEPTTRPYDTTSYGEDASYTYRVIYDYLSRFYETSQLLETDTIDDQTLSGCDVLVVKIPTARFGQNEVDAIERFVRLGGGLLLVGDHTDVFKSSTYLNDIARPLGFTFRNDLLFTIESAYDQTVHRPTVPHPVVQHLPTMHYAVSCSIDPGLSLGRAVVRSTGLWNLPPDYHADNYHPPAEYRPEMRYGAFIQLWATRHEEGRVLAFTDSTIFSNFCIFQEGKTELMLGMIEWLNHTSPLDRRAVGLPVAAAIALAGVVLFAGGLFFSRRHEAGWLAVLCASIFGAAVGSAAVVAVHRRAMPEPRAVRPMQRVIIDRSVSEAPLSLGAYVTGDGEGYGLLEQWIPRLGYFTARGEGLDVFGGDALVVLCPTRSVSRAYRERLKEYVAGGGRLLVIDSPASAGSTANSLLWPFGMTMIHATAAEGKLIGVDGEWPGIEAGASCEVTGGEPLMWVGQTVVAARTAVGEGSVTAIGFGSLLNDQNFGITWLMEPEAETLERYDVLFAVIESLVEGRPGIAPLSGEDDP